MPGLGHDERPAQRRRSGVADKSTTSVVLPIGVENVIIYLQEVIVSNVHPLDEKHLVEQNPEEVEDKRVENMTTISVFVKNSNTCL